MKRDACFESLYFRHISSSILFAGGVLTAPALILQDNLLIKFYQTFGFLLLNLIIGKNLMIVGAFLFFICTVSINLLSPFGLVLHHFGPLWVTEGALKTGLQKGFNMAGLLYLSRFSIRSDLRLPGRIGLLLSRMFFYLHYLIEEKKRVKPGNLTETLDALLIRIQERNMPDFISPEGQRTLATHYGTLFVMLMIGFNWVLLF